MTNNIIPIEETKKEEKKQEPKKQEKDIKNISNLPTWNIEPPLKINRGQK